MTDSILCDIDSWLHIASAAFVFPFERPKPLGTPYELHFSFGQLKVRRERPAHNFTHLVYEFYEFVDGELRKVFVFYCAIERGIHKTGHKYLFINEYDTHTKFLLYPYIHEHRIEYYNDTTLSDVEHFMTLMKLSTPSVLGLYNNAR